MTQTKIFKELKPNPWLINYLDEAGHGSVLEHISFTFLLECVSRSFLAQVTRHRTGKFTSASQHYADYRDMPMMVHEKLVTNPHMIGALNHSLEAYIAMVEEGIPVEEARQVLPNACAVTLVWTVDLRNLIHFMQIRSCNRNVTEMRIFCDKVRGLLPAEIKTRCLPDCRVSGKCLQGPMQCKEGSWQPAL